MKILIVDDDRDLVDLLTFALRRAGFDPAVAYDGPTALKRFEEAPDLAILDINLGGWNGFDLLKDLRRHSQIPVIVLTGRDAEEDKVAGLDWGADDYITKPFSHRELVSRIRAVLRRQGREWSPPTPAELTQVGPITINAAEHVASKRGESLELTVTEFRLLQYLAMNAGTVVPTRAILRHVWGYDDPTGADVVRVAVHRLRRKLGDDATNPQLLHTVSGVGFMLKAPEAP